MRYDSTLITRSLQMYFSGMSVRDVADCYEQEEIEISYQTIYNWIEKYSKLTHDYLKGIVSRVSETWRTDEILYVSTSTPKSTKIVGRYRRKTCSLLTICEEKGKEFR